MPQLPQLRLPHQISQLFHQLSTTSDHDSYDASEDSGLDDRCSCTSECEHNEEERFMGDSMPAFFLRFQGTRDSDVGDSSSEDELDRVGRFVLPNYPAATASKPKKSAKKKKVKRKNKKKTTNNEESTTNIVAAEDSEQWLVQKYFRQFNESWTAMRNGIGIGGEPTGIVAAEEPEVFPPIRPVRLPESSVLSAEASMNNGLYTSTEHPPGPSTLDHPNALKKKSKKKKKRVVHKQPRSIHGGFGEAELRERIKEIQNLQLPDRDRDKRIQRLMTEQYYRITNTVPPEDLEDDTEDGDETDQYEDAEGESENEMDTKETESDTHRPVATVKDLEPTYFDITDDVYGCKHYQRGCKLECSTCFKWYTCRLCHDEVEGHKLIRPETRHMLCMYCGLVQSAAQNCSGCHVEMAQYYCDKCKLWDDDCSKSIYHCDDCGLCRIGKGLGKDFFHCQTCNVCMSIDLQNSHRCIEHSTECDCPICGDYMFSSTETVVFMQCGHSIHQGCYRLHTQTSYKCPTCSRSIINMVAQFRILDAEIERQPVPEPYDRWRAVIVCNDCLAKSMTPFHFLGLKCNNCGSYNTAQHKIIKPHEQDFLTTDDESATQQFGRNNNNSISWNMAVGSLNHNAAQNTNAASVNDPQVSFQYTPYSHAIEIASSDVGSYYSSDDDNEDNEMPGIRLLHF